MKRKALSTLIDEESEEINPISKNYSESQGKPINQIKEKHLDESLSENSVKKERKKEYLEKEFKIKKKVKKEALDKQQFISNENNRHKTNEKDQNLKKKIQLDLPKFNITKYFYDILSLANKDEDFLMMISNILTTGSRQLVKNKEF